MTQQGRARQRQVAGLLVGQRERLERYLILGAALQDALEECDGLFNLTAIRLLWYLFSSMIVPSASSDANRAMHVQRVAGLPRKGNAAARRST